MKRTRFGRTELEVSRIALGGIPLMRVPHDDAVGIVKEALHLGINFIDTAHGYHDSEEKIGAAIKGVPRDELVITTKTHAKDRQGLVKDLDLSLNRLGVEHIDIYQLHNINQKNRDEIFGPGGSFEGLSEAIQSGKVRFPAFSSHSITLAIEIMSENRFDALQLPFNYIVDEALTEVIPLAQKLDMGFIAMKPMGGGMLYDAGLSFRYLMQFDSIVPDPGIEKIEELREIVAVVEACQPFTDEDRAEVERLRGELGSTWCHRCDYCQPCPQGIPISSVLSLRSFLKRFNVEGARTRMGNATEKARNCIECQECMQRCPYELDIPKLLKENTAYWDSFFA